MKAYKLLYHSYLLRIWKDCVDSEWRASLQEVATGECHYFSCLPDLLAFLESQGDTILTRQFPIEHPIENSLTKD